MKKDYYTGKYKIRIGKREKLSLLILITLGIWGLLYFAEFWFWEGHPRNTFFFIVLSVVVFWGVLRSFFTWIFYFFVRLPIEGKTKKKYSLDVMTTAMPGEPYEMFANTLLKISQLDYTHTSYLLDGGNDPKLKELCLQTGTIHVNCEGVEGAKAGKINYCLKHFAKGELVFVIDPDHMPEPEMFEKVVHHFDKKRVGFVQIVQAYYNQNNTIVSQAVAEQTYGFYGPTMMALNGVGIPFAIGANCTFRRKTLDDIGGHAIGLAEDVQTSIRIHSKGWKSIYVPFRGSYGLVPETLSSYFKQQLKWSCGMFKMLFEEYPRAFKGLNLAGKLYYFYAGTHYLSGLITFLTLILPVIFLFGKIYAIEMALTDFLLHLAPYLIFSFSINMYIQRWYSCPKEKRIPWRSMLLEKGTWHIYLMGFIYAVIGKEVLWLPTPKTKELQSSALLVLPHAISILLSVSAIVFASITYQHIDAGTLLMMFFAAVNALVLLPVFAFGITKQRGM